jgi:hypothetical protein
MLFYIFDVYFLNMNASLTEKKAAQVGSFR